MNEEGLYVGVYYLPGFAEYSSYDPDKSDKSMSVGDFMQWMLSSFKTVKEIEQSLNDIIVVDVINEEFGGAALPLHFKISDPTGESIVIEIVNKGEIKVYKPFLGVITNSPTYDWHLTNLRNYLFLSPNPQNTLAIDDLNLSPLGGGSGFLGLPGDFTPPSRFIRAAAFTASARPLATSLEAVFESFRILDNFNIPLGAQVPSENISSEIVSATQITTASDLKEKVFYYHTMWNREIRKIDLKQIDFSKINESIIDDDKDKTNRTKDVTNLLIGDGTMVGECIGLKDYVWSVAQNKCADVAGSGSPFYGYDPKTGNENTKKIAYVLLSDDHLKAEIFFNIQNEKPILLNSKPAEEGELMPVIFENKDEMINIRYYKDDFQILYYDRIIYTQSSTIENALGKKIGVI